MTKNFNKNRKNKRTNSYPSLRPSTTVYRGPISTPASDTEVITLRDSFDISSNAGGVVALRFDNNPSSARNWTELSTVFNDYRVLGIRYKYFPVNVVNTATFGGIFGYNSIVHGSISLPTTLPQASSVGLAQPWTAFRRFTREWRMSEVVESVFQLCSAPAATSNTLLLYGTTGGINLDYGTIMIEYLIQYRTHVQ